MTTYRVTFCYSVDVETEDELDAEDMAWGQLVEVAASGCSPDDFPATVEEV